MKKLFTALTLFILAASAISAQDIDLQIAVTTQEMSRDFLRNLNLTDRQIEELIALQEQFREVRTQTALERNVIKAQLARELHKADADEREIDRMLERASELRLEQERAQVRTYLQIRRMLGEETWSEFVRRIRVQQKIRDRYANDPQARRGEGSPGTGAGTSGPGVSGSGSSGAGGSAGSGSGNSDRN